jgi:hypothetical protein
MFRAVYRQIARFLNWVNGSDGSSTNQAIKEAAEQRRDLESRAGLSPWDSGGGGGGI